MLRSLHIVCLIIFANLWFVHPAYAVDSVQNIPYNMTPQLSTVQGAVCGASPDCFERTGRLEAAIGNDRLHALCQTVSGVGSPEYIVTGIDNFSPNRLRVCCCKAKIAYPQVLPP